ncbi:MAG: hypothetical protein FWG82_01645 [Oscillospiraceae bacterium]|nr:hypothetical protein [Oscillospiraceae bacterium]
MLYKNTPCPGCDHNMTSDDDVVTCPDCGAPQHRQCWMRENRCVLADKHGEGFAWQKPEEEEVPVSDPLKSHIERWEKQQDIELDTVPEPTSFFCPNCGRKNTAEYHICEHCEYLFYAPSPTKPPVPGVPRVWIAPSGGPDYIPPSEDLGGAYAGDLALFVQRNLRGYILKFKRFSQNSRTFAFNFAAFVFHGYWFLFRKMPAIGAIFISINVALNLLQAWMLNFFAVGREYLAASENFTQALMGATLDEEILRSVISAQQGILPIVLSVFGAKIIAGLVAGFIGDRLYYRRAIEVVSTLRVIHRDDAKFQMAVLNEGRSSVIKSVLIYLLLSYLTAQATNLLF